MSDTGGVEGLTSAERKHLRGEAMKLKPLIQVGKSGMSPAVIAALNKALDEKKLVKVRILDESRDQRAQVATALQEVCPSERVGQVGKVYVFYRRQPLNES